MRRNPSRYKVPITINRVSIQARFLESRVKCIFESLGSTTFAVHCRQGGVRSRLFVLAVSNFCGWRWLNPIFRSNSYIWLLIGQGQLSQGQKKAPQSEVSLCCFALSSVIFHDPSPSHFIALHLLVPVELLLPVRTRRLGVPTCAWSRVPGLTSDNGELRAGQNMVFYRSRGYCISMQAGMLILCIGCSYSSIKILPALHLPNRLH
jgi:hypothetical protein